MIEELVAQLKSKGAFLPEPVKPGGMLEALLELRENGLDIPNDYVDFLEIADGLHWEGLMFYGVESLPPDDMGVMIHGIAVQNDRAETLPEGHTLIGRTTDGLAFTCTADGAYHEIDAASGDEFESFESFAALLRAKSDEKLAALREQGITV